MRLVRWIALCTAMVCGGCNPSGDGGALEAFGGGKSVSSGSTTAATPESFLAAYRTAHAQGDVDALMQLYCWDGVPGELRETIRGNLQDQVMQPITGMELTPADPQAFGETQSSGRRWRPNLPVTNMLVVQFSGQGSFGLTSIQAGVGQRDGQYLLVVSVPVN